MTAHCHEPDELAILATLPEGDSRRRHLDRCPRCRALSMSYSEFLHDRSLPEGADPADAEARLTRTFRGEQARRKAANSDGRASFPGSVLPRSGRSFHWLLPSWRRPAFALAVVVMLAGTAYLGWEWTLHGHGPDVLRGGSPSPSVGSPGPSRQTTWLLPVERDPAGHPVLRWRSQPGADGYQVRLFGSDLSDFARIGPQVDTVLVLDPRILPPGAPSTGEIGWQVVAQRQGRPLAASPPAAVLLR
jgi:hypothetical protein